MPDGLAALIWDFDGTIADTESIEYESARQVFLEHGADLAVSAWWPIVGTLTAPDWIGPLEAAVGRRLDAGALLAARRRHHARLTDALVPRPGVTALLDEATAAGVPMAVCSNSSRRWVCGHLARLGLAPFFAAVVAVDDVEHAKPHAEPYLAACRRLGASPRASVAIEDSTTGVTAAVVAGLAVLAVAGPMTAAHDLSAADRQVESLTDVAFADLAALATAPRPRAR